MPRIQVLWLPGRTTERPPFALIVDRVDPGDDADFASERSDALYEFGRDIGAAGVLITTDTIDLPENLEVAEDPSPAWTPPVFAPRAGAGVRTHEETRVRAPGSR